MSKEQLEIVGRLREVKDPESLHMLGQFLALLKSNGTKDHRSSGFMGLNQFLTFLNQVRKSKTLSKKQGEHNGMGASQRATN